VADTADLAAAARKLRMSPPAVSRAITAKQEPGSDLALA